MFSAFSRPRALKAVFYPGIKNLGLARRTQRPISVISTHSTFPATLLRFQSLQSSGLFNFGAHQEHDVVEDGVIVSNDGLVYPAVSTNLPFSNGATFLPNTFMMQEMIRTYFDEYLEGLGSSRLVQPPLVLSISKGVPIPSTLTLFREHSSRFSLQPSDPMPLFKLNSILDVFYSIHADTTTAEQWLNKNAFEDAVADDAEGQWMAR